MKKNKILITGAGGSLGQTLLELLNDKDYDDESEPKLEANNIADAVLYALSQPDSVNVNELLIKPTGKS